MGLAYLANPQISLRGRQGLEPQLATGSKVVRVHRVEGAGKQYLLYLNISPAILLARVLAQNKNGG